MEQVNNITYPTILCVIEHKCQDAELYNLIQFTEKLKSHLDDLYKGILEFATAP
jgi:predicted transcriptional regulator